VAETITTEEQPQDDDMPAEGRSVEELMEDTAYPHLPVHQSRVVAYRELISANLHAALRTVGEEDLQPGALDGVRIITHGDLEAALSLRDTPYPPPTEHAADVVTPATITIYGICPNCGEGTYLSTALSVELRVGSSRELRLVSSGSKASHSCGQQAWRAAAAQADGQQTLEDAIEEEDEEDLDEEDDPDD
jgi:hypothetical protein